MIACQDRRPGLWEVVQALHLGAIQHAQERSQQHVKFQQPVQHQNSSIDVPLRPQDRTRIVRVRHPARRCNPRHRAHPRPIGTPPHPHATIRGHWPIFTRRREPCRCCPTPTPLPRRRRDRVLLVHGFTGSPRSMKDWGRYLADAGFTVSVPRLPGHGTSWQEMNKTRWEDWYGEAERELRDLSRRCRVGLPSWGCRWAARWRCGWPRRTPRSPASCWSTPPCTQASRPAPAALPAPRRAGASRHHQRHQEAGRRRGRLHQRFRCRRLTSLLQLWAKVREDITEVHQPLLLFPQHR